MIGLEKCRLHVIGLDSWNTTLGEKEIIQISHNKLVLLSGYIEFFVWNVLAILNLFCIVIVVVVVMIVV
jgi:hypothetical protein